MQLNFFVQISKNLGFETYSTLHIDTQRKRSIAPHYNGSSGVVNGPAVLHRSYTPGF
jgi:hypothetical protein